MSPMSQLKASNRSIQRRWHAKQKVRGNKQMQPTYQPEKIPYSDTFHVVKSHGYFVTFKFGACFEDTC